MQTVLKPPNALGCWRNKFLWPLERTGAHPVTLTWFSFDDGVNFLDGMGMPLDVVHYGRYKAKPQLRQQLVFSLDQRSWASRTHAASAAFPPQEQLRARACLEQELELKPKRNSDRYFVLGLLYLACYSRRVNPY